MNRELDRKVRERAGQSCEYCRIPQFALPLPFQIDHVIAAQHQGQTELPNLALACPHCNRYKGPNIAGLDPLTGQLVRLFHPRRDEWADHFDPDGARINGRTPVGRATVQVLGDERRGADPSAKAPPFDGIEAPGELLPFRRFPPQFVEEVQQKRQVRGRPLVVRIVGDECGEALAVRR